MPCALAIFDRIYVINLASRTDRRAEMAAQLRRIGLAIDSPQVQVFEAVRPADAGGFSTIGTRGCFMSHLGVLKDAAARGLRSVLILEDDLNFEAGFTTRAPDLLAGLAAQDWSMFYGGYELPRPLPPSEGCVEIDADVPIQTSHFLALRGTAIGDVVAYFEQMLSRPAGDPLGGPMHVDGAYWWFRKAFPQHRSFIARPILGYQRSSRTDIHELHWIDKTPGLRSIAALLRRARNRRNPEAN